MSYPLIVKILFQLCWPQSNVISSSTFPNNNIHDISFTHIRVVEAKAGCIGTGLWGGSLGQHHRKAGHDGQTDNHSFAHDVTEGFVTFIGFYNIFPLLGSGSAIGSLRVRRTTELASHPQLAFIGPYLFPIFSQPLSMPAVVEAPGSVTDLRTSDVCYRPVE